MNCPVVNKKLSLVINDGHQILFIAGLVKGTSKNYLFAGIINREGGGGGGGVLYNLIFSMICGFRLNNGLIVNHELRDNVIQTNSFRINKQGTGGKLYCNL